MSIDHEQRKHSIGASEVASVLGISPYRSAYEMWMEKTGKVAPWPGNTATQLGKQVEPFLLDRAEEKYGQISRNVRLASPNGAPLSATLDGLVVDSHHPIECKTAGLLGGFATGDWGKAFTDQIPDYYLVQVQAQLYCSGADLAHVFALLGTRGVVEYAVPRDDALIKIIVSRCSQWWETHMAKRVEPEIKTPPPLELMKRLYRTPNKVTLLDGAAGQILDVYESAKKDLRRAEEVFELAQSTTIAMLGDAEEGLLPDGRRVTYYEQHRKSYIVKECSYRVLRVKE